MNDVFNSIALQLQCTNAYDGGGGGGAKKSHFYELHILHQQSKKSHLYELHNLHQQPPPPRPNPRYTTATVPEISQAGVYGDCVLYRNQVAFNGFKPLYF